jgi:hypothetical protein
MPQIHSTCVYIALGLLKLLLKRHAFLLYGLLKKVYVTLIRTVELMASAQAQAHAYVLLVSSHHSQPHGMLLVVRGRCGRSLSVFLREFSTLLIKTHQYKVCRG